MRAQDSFSAYHPAVKLLYFALVGLFAMCVWHPACLLISLCAALSYRLALEGGKALCHSLRFLLPMLLLAAALNPLFNHKGATILCYLPSGNPLTLESILYGVAAGFMLLDLLLWLSCWQAVMSTDEFVYLFGRVLPALSLLLSMSFRFVPRFVEQAGRVRETQSLLRGEKAHRGLLGRVKQALAILSILITWSLEGAIETADSMKSRGYGLPGRTAFSLYRLEERDKIAAIWLLCCGSYVLAGLLCGGLAFRYYPRMQGGPLGPFPLSFLLAYLALCLTPLMVRGWEDRRWRH